MMGIKIRPSLIGSIIIEYLLVVSLILNCRSMLVTLAGGPNYANLVRMLIVLLCICSLLFKMVISRKEFTRSFIIAITLGVYLLLFWVQDSHKSSAFIYNLTVFLFLYVYEKNCDTIKNGTSSLLLKYSNVICIIAFISICFWLFGSYFEIIKATGSVNSSWSGQEGVYITFPSYYGVYFETQKINFFGILKIIRNSACFTEAPMANFHFCLALLVELFYKSKINVKRIILLSIAMGTTFSTTGYIVLLFALFFKFASREGSRRKNVVKFISIPIIVMIVFFVAENLVQSRLSSVSGSLRVDDIYAGFSAWKDNILFGNGYGNEASYQKYMSNFRGYNTGFSNSILQILAYGGLYLALPYIWGIVSGIKNSLLKKNWDKVIFALLFLILMTFTITPFTGIVMYVLIIISNKRIVREGIS